MGDANDRGFFRSTLMTRLFQLAPRTDTAPPAHRPPERQVEAPNPVWQRLATEHSMQRRSSRAAASNPLEHEAERVAHDLVEDPDYVTAHAAGWPRTDG